MGRDIDVPPMMPKEQEDVSKLLKQYGCGPVQFSGTDNALYERHLIFDNVIDLKTAGTRERFEAFARSVRDVLSQRWVRTEDTYNRVNPKAYLLSFDGISHRPFTGQQCHESSAR